ncbi:MAG: hypothetical protein ACRC7O_07285 [Fimbriiglobus sp.]
MTRLASTNLIAVFSFYLASVALISFARRYLVYLDAVRLVVALRGRWPRVVDRLKAQYGVLVTREVLAPTGVAVGLMFAQLVCSRVIWPAAALPAGVVWDSAWRSAVLLIAAVPMLLVDGYFLLRVGTFDRGATVQYLDLAEHWLTSWKGPAVRVATLGYLNPRRMVDDEVRKGLEQVGQMVGWSMRWVAIQVACRVGFGLAVWLVWAIGA